MKGQALLKHCNHILPCTYHKSCYLKYTSGKVQRLQKRLLVTSDAATSPKKTIHQLNVSAVNKFRVYPTKFNDSGLLAKLAMSDMHALDAQYHRKCLIS